MYPDAVAGEIAAWLDAGVFETIDVEAAREVFERAGRGDAPAFAWLLAGLTFRAYRDGHSRLNLLTEGMESWRPSQQVPWISDRAAIEEIFADVPEVFGTGATTSEPPRQPFVVSNDGLYIARVLDEEKKVAEWLRADGGARVDIILGGPGTGKTWTIAERLRLHESPVPSIALCAPTGKASRHLKTVLDRQLRENGASHEVLEMVERAPSETAHRLLGYNPDGKVRYKKRKGSPLDFELVIVDEASMMSLSLIHRLLDALPPTARIWLVGDPDQLASVDAGSVLADIRSAAKSDKCVLKARTKVLDEQRRFGPDSAIAALATAVRDHEMEKVRAVLEGDHDDVVWIDPSRDHDRLRVLTENVVDHARRVVTAATAGDATLALTVKSELQILCATRVGPSGVDAWNELIERALGPSTASRTYVGRPVLVTRNDPATGLSNGDVGILCRDGNGTRAWFGDPGNPTGVSLARLPETSTVHALTIHKSQGSEYDHAVVVIPSGESRVLTRELVYTGVTRPRTKLTIIATWDSLKSALERDARRATGLESRLVGEPRD